MTTSELLKQLRVQHKLLEQEVLQHDAKLPKGQRRLLQDTERFNNELFIQTGAELSSCIGQMNKSIQQLEKLINNKISSHTILLSCQRIQDRFTAVKRALATTSLDAKSAEQQKKMRIVKAQQRRHQSHNNSGFNWIAAGVMQNSHKLYEELTKHLNWVKAFEQKIQNMQSKLDDCHSTDKINIQNEILLVHRRLGKCRQAISYIEERIQAFERPQTHTYRRFNR